MCCGADGETIVGPTLEDFEDEFLVINDPATSFGNLDHAVVGPAGEFVVDTKAWRDTIAADGGAELLQNGKPTQKLEIRAFLRRMISIRGQVAKLAAGFGQPFYKGLFVFTAARVEAKWGITGTVHCIGDDQLLGCILDKKYSMGLPPNRVKVIAQAFLALAHVDSDFTGQTEQPLPAAAPATAAASKPNPTPAVRTAPPPRVQSAPDLPSAGQLWPPAPGPSKSLPPPDNLSTFSETFRHGFLRGGCVLSSTKNAPAPTKNQL